MGAKTTSVSAKETRLRAGKSQEWVAVHGGTSVPSVRLYELDPEQLRLDKRESLARVYADLAIAGRSGRAA
jgi:hypothetical protein